MFGKKEQEELNVLIVVNSTIIIGRKIFHYIKLPRVQQKEEKHITAFNHI